MTEGARPGFGQTLRDARGAAGRELEDVAEATRIPQRALRALEEEDWWSVPEGVIGRGFVRLVARELGLPVEETLGRYREARGEEGPPPRLVPTEADWKVDLRRERGPGPVFLAVLFLLGAGLGIWVWSPWSVDIAPPVAEEPAAAPASPVAVEATAPPADEASSPAPAPPPEAEREGGPEVPPAAKAEPAPPPALESAPPAAPEPAAEPTPSVHRLEIRAVEKVWVRTAVDGGPNRERVLSPGQTEVVEAKERATIRLGNAGGVRLSWDGEALKVPGAAGQVRTLNFPGALERLRP